MDSQQAINAVIDRLNRSSKPVQFGFDELQAWQQGLLEGFIKAGLLTKDVAAQSLTCSGCEQHCFMPVVYTEEQQRAFIVCDDPDQQDHMGRIAVSLDRLQQWQTSAKQMAALIARLLGVTAKPTYQQESASYALGMLKRDSGRRVVSLTVQPLALVINQQPVELDELLYFDGDQLVIDRPRVDELLNTAPSPTGKAYNPDTSKREARKLATQAMYQDWNDAYRKFKQQYPDKKDSWHSFQIAKLPVAQGRDSETIRKKMKF